MRVSFFATCLVDRVLPDAGLAAARLLRSLGVEVVVPRNQTCCGQPAFNAGYREEARRIAEHALRVFNSTDYVVVPSGSCAAMLRKHYTELLGDDGASAAVQLANRTFELSEFIVRVLHLSTLGQGLRGRRVAYHHGCHALRDLGLREEPVLLLENAGAELVAWEAAEECCGFGGLFSVKLPHVSAAMADRKLDTLPGIAATTSGDSRDTAVAASRTPDVLTSADGGCLLQLEGRMRHRHIAIPVRHLAHLLEEAMSGRP